jgi:hypothetical protein
MNFLFNTNVGLDAVFGIESELGEETHTVLVESSVGTEKRCLLIKSRTIVRDKGGGDENGVAAAENGRRGVNGKVSSSSVRGTETTIGVGRTIGFSLDKSLALEILDDFTVLVKLEHDVLDLSGQTVTDTTGGHGLEPVAIDIGSTVKCPLKIINVKK